MKFAAKLRSGSERAHCQRNSDNIAHRKMNSAGQTIWTTLIRTFCVISVIACLCFSAGEGLRLTPLPALPLEEINSSAPLVDATISRGTSEYLGGPLARPAQVQAQKPGKRQLLDCECPLNSGAGETSFHPLQYVATSDPCDHLSHFPDAQPPSRAPPRLS